MINLVYDIPIGDAWKISLGGGVGGGNARVHLTVPGTAFDWADQSHLSFEYQGIAGHRLFALARCRSVRRLSLSLEPE